MCDRNRVIAHIIGRQWNASPVHSTFLPTLTGNEQPTGLEGTLTWQSSSSLYVWSLLCSSFLTMAAAGGGNRRIGLIAFGKCLPGNCIVACYATSVNADLGCSQQISLPAGDKAFPKGPSQRMERITPLYVRILSNLCKDSCAVMSSTRF